MLEWTRSRRHLRICKLVPSVVLNWEEATLELNINISIIPVYGLYADSPGTFECIVYEC